MTKRRWQRAGLGMAVIGFGLLVWIELDPVTSFSGAVAWGVVLLAYGLSVLVWSVVGVPFLLQRYFGRNRPINGPEADYDDRPRDH